MVEVKVAYKGQLRCEAVHGPSNGTLITDAPVDNHGKGESFSPTDLVATALGSCMLTIMGIAAQARDIDMTGSSVTVEKHMSADLPRRISQLVVELKVSLPESHPQRELLEKAALACPVHHSIHPDIDTQIRFVWGCEVS